MTASMKVPLSEFTGNEEDEDDKYYLNLFGFIYGTIPPSPSVLPYAQQYG